MLATVLLVLVLCRLIALIVVNGHGGARLVLATVLLVLMLCRLIALIVVNSARIILDNREHGNRVADVFFRLGIPVRRKGARNMPQAPFTDHADDDTHHRQRYRKATNEDRFIATQRAA